MLGVGTRLMDEGNESSCFYRQGSEAKRSLTARTICQIFGFLLRFFVNMPYFLAKNEQKAKKTFYERKEKSSSSI